ncbi:CUE domain containing 1 [Cricetulus griseus]
MMGVENSSCSRKNVCPSNPSSSEALELGRLPCTHPHGVRGDNWMRMQLPVPQQLLGSHRLTHLRFRRDLATFTHDLILTPRALVTPSVPCSPLWQDDSRMWMICSTATAWPRSACRHHPGPCPLARAVHQASLWTEEAQDRPARQVRRLEFNQAMDDFKTMFPNMDYDIIECVLRANSGAVDATIDQLLQMNLEAGGGSTYEDSSDSEDSIPPEILERTLEPDSSEEEPPPVYSPPAYHMHVFDRPYPVAPPAPPPRIDVLGSGQPASQSRYRNWNPPLLGNLPDDFLRILPQQMESIQGHPGGSKPMGGERGPAPVPGSGACDQDSRWKQYLEDERIALFLQNEEFMKELQRNRDFLLALERDRLKYESQKSKSSNVAAGNDLGLPSSVPGTSDTNPTVSEDALFRDKLKHMGKSLYMIPRLSSPTERHPSFLLFWGTHVRCQQQRRLARDALTGGGNQRETPGLSSCS